MRPPRKLTLQLLPINRLHIPPLRIQTAQIPRNIPPIKLPHIKPIPHKRKPVLIPPLKLIILISRPLQQMQEMQPRAGIQHGLPAFLAAAVAALLEPAAARGGPGSALEEEVGVLAKIGGGAGGGREGFDVFGLQFGDDVEHVGGPDFDEGHEGSVAEGAVGAAEGEVVGEARDAETEVGGEVVGAGPEVAQVDAGAVDDGEAWDPGCVEACGADDHVYGVLGAVLVDEAGGCDAFH